MRPDCAVTIGAGAIDDVDRHRNSVRALGQAQGVCRRVRCGTGARPQVHGGIKRGEQNIAPRNIELLIAQTLGSSLSELMQGL
jgi:hypothetical protein